MDSISADSKRLIESDWFIKLKSLCASKAEIEESKKTMAEWGKVKGKISLMLRLLCVPLLVANAICMVCLQVWLGNSLAELSFNRDTAITSPSSLIGAASSYIEGYFPLGGVVTGAWEFLGINILVWMASLLTTFLCIWFVEKPVSEILKRGLFKVVDTQVDEFHCAWSKASSKGPDNMAKLASMFERNGVAEKNLNVAVSLHSLAGELGSKDSALYVAHSFKSGEGVKVDMDKYVAWLIRAADLGSYKAITELAALRAPKPKDASCLGYIVAGLALGIILS